MNSIRDLLSKVFTAYMAGLISGLVIEIIWILVTTHSLNLNEDLKLELYRMMIWGGVWALLLVSPFPKNIWVRSAAMALIVILFNYMIRMPYSGDGFFASNAGNDVFYANLIFNCPWALLAGFIYTLASNK